MRPWPEKLTPQPLARTEPRASRASAVEQPAPTVDDPRAEPRTTRVVAGSRIDLLEALDRLEREHPLLVEPLVLTEEP
ncbi:hypothetical protein [Streptomyces sp. NPDC057280]|uniref:hypothetical protein n=1 Tax=Streptomyces sp. NPDC057280 TaxID=3346081 RepID=UPI0036325527